MEKAKRSHLEAVSDAWRTLILDEIGDLPFPEHWFCWYSSGCRVGSNGPTPTVICEWGSARLYIGDGFSYWTINYHEEDSEVVKAYIRNIASP